MRDALSTLHEHSKMGERYVQYSHIWNDRLIFFSQNKENVTNLTECISPDILSHALIRSRLNDFSHINLITDLNLKEVDSGGDIWQFKAAKPGVQLFFRQN